MTRFVQLAQARRNILPERRSFWARFNFNQQKISLVIFFGLIFSGFAYLAVINNVSTGGFDLKRLEQRIEQLKDENRKLELEATKLESLNTIAAAGSQLELKLADKVEYLERKPPAVALGR
jgi:cell division protein FtsB